MAVEWALKSQFDPTEPRHFSGIGRYYPGWSDRPAGVQWSLWHDLHAPRVVLAVNLEGMADGNTWPIGHVIQRELAKPQLPTLAKQSANEVEVWVGRDVWNPGGRGKLKSDDFLDSTLPAVSEDQWRHAIEEARSAENEKGDGRGSLEVLLKKGVLRVCGVSPHIYFAIALWGSALPPHDERAQRLQAARAKLEPLHAFLIARAAS